MENEMEEDASCAEIHIAVPRWAGQVEEVILLSDSVDGYVDYCVTSDSECPSSKTAGPFADVPINGNEKDMYLPLTNGLERLVEDFPTERRLRFIELESGAHEINFPYDPWGNEHLITSPDIVASLPGMDKDKLMPPQWRNISLAIEVEPSSENDPFTGRGHLDDQLSLADLGKCALNMLLAHNRRWVFVIGVYGPTARIFRFDRNRAVVSRAFNYVENPQLLRNFFWRFVHPEDKACNVVGADPSVRMPNGGDIAWARKMLKKSGRPPLTKADLKACRWVTLSPPFPGAPTETFLAIRLLFVRAQLFSRTTMIWEALKEGDHSGETTVIKDCWKLPEDEF